jgi:hypothetical protein
VYIPTFPSALPSAPALEGSGLGRINRWHVTSIPGGQGRGSQQRSSRWFKSRCLSHYYGGWLVIIG